MIEYIEGDCLQVLKQYPDRHFSAACFSPPYGTKGQGFDIATDFGAGGKFVDFMDEITRVADITAVNFTQRVESGSNLSLFTEKLTLALDGMGIHLFDRWVLTKKVPMPQRGNRALTNFEFLLLYTRQAPQSILCNPEGARCTTAFEVKSHGSSNVRVLGTTPYFIEIPAQLFRMYGHGKVLDPFAGSGTSLLAAEQLGLDSVGIELNHEVYMASKPQLSRGTLE